MQDDAAATKSRTGLMGVLTRNKDGDAQQAQHAALPASQSKPGRFANLRAKLGRPSEQTEVTSHTELRMHVLPMAMPDSMLSQIACSRWQVRSACRNWLATLLSFSRCCHLELCLQG